MTLSILLASIGTGALLCVVAAILDAFLRERRQPSRRENIGPFPSSPTDW